MKRLALSLLGGILLPIGYAMIAGPLSVYIDNRGLKYFLTLPVAWPRVLLFTFAYSASVSISDNLFVVLMIVCNVTVYSIVTYVALLALSFRRVKRKVEGPPLPTVENVH